MTTLQEYDCHRCEERYSLDDLAGTNRNGNWLCEDCVMNHGYTYAECCDAYVTHFNSDYDVCSRCAEDYVTCEDCGYSAHCDSYAVIWSDYRDAWYCESCFPGDEDMLPGVYDYHSGHPMGLRFIGNGRAHFGVEFELAGYGDPSFTLSRMDDKHLAHGEMDSSVDGFEFISQPATLDEWRGAFGLDIMRALEELQREGFSGNDTQCGQHVHISRKAFDNPAHIARFAAFFTLNPTDIVELSGRDSEYHLSNYADVCTMQYGALMEGSKVGTPGFYRTRALPRMAAVNLTNADTVEIRIWAGTDNFEHTLGAIEFIAALVEYTRDMDSTDVAIGALHRDNVETFLNTTARYRHARALWNDRVTVSA